MLGVNNVVLINEARFMKLQARTQAERIRREDIFNNPLILNVPCWFTPEQIMAAIVMAVGDVDSGGLIVGIKF